MAGTGKYAFDRRYYENLRRVSFEGNAARQLMPMEEDYSYEDDYAEEEDSYEDDYAQDYADEEYADEEYADSYRHGAAEHYNEADEDYCSDSNADADAQAEPRIRTHYEIEFNVYAVLAFCGLISLLVCMAFQMLNLKSDITQTQNQLKKAETALNEVQALNDSLLNQLDTMADRNYIYTVAVGKLGMQYPNQNQVITYEASQSGYVRQMSLIPE